MASDFTLAGGHSPAPLNPPDPPPPSEDAFDPDAPEVDLTSALQSLQISTRSYDDGWENEDEAEYEFSLLVKVAEGIPAPRIVPIQGMRADMKRAWGQNYGAISEVQPNLFLATFKTHEKMLTILKRQPWVVGRRDTLLFEWYEPTRDISSYTFQYLYTTVKFFGVPSDLRDPRFVKILLDQVGEPSDLDQISNGTLFRDPHSISARAKIDVTKKAVDRIKISAGPTSPLTIFVHYEKINKICTFCAGFFHNAIHCQIRENLVISAPKDIPKKNPL